MRQFMSGLIVAGYLIAALFFLRFWRQTSDRLFLMFALAFTGLATQRALLALWQESETMAWVHALRFLAFLLIIAAVIDRNRPTRH
jgi:hypothetical protein